MSILIPKTPRNPKNDAKVKRWLGSLSLFDDYRPPRMWVDKNYNMLGPPPSVTFPICRGCCHVVWDWPHFEEEVPKEVLCDDCAEEEMKSQ